MIRNLFALLFLINKTSLKKGMKTKEGPLAKPFEE